MKLIETFYSLKLLYSILASLCAGGAAYFWCDAHFYGHEIIASGLMVGCVQYLIEYAKHQPRERDWQGPRPCGGGSILDDEEPR